jgi:predicted Zn-dependent peptidase
MVMAARAVPSTVRDDIPKNLQRWIDPVLTSSSVYQKTDLPNGLRVVTERIPAVRSASVGIWVTVGSRHENAAENGISHFIEHMAFKGTKTRSAYDIARTIEQGGGYINAFTSKEITCFHVHVLDERVPDAFGILADILRHPRYDPAEIEKEKQVILDEIRDHLDLPDDLVHERFVQALFEPHPLARPILGPPENVRAFTRQNVLSFSRRHYAPANIVITAAGHVDHEALVAQASQLLNFDANDASRRRQPALGKLKSQFVRVSRPIQQAHMVLGTRSLSYSDHDRFVLSALNTVLGGGMSSRLFQNIREKHGIAYSVYAFAEMLGDSGMWGVYLATDPGRVDRAREMVLKELKIMREQPLTPAELDSVKTQLKGNIMLGLENVSSRMMRLGRMEIYLGRYHSLEDVSRQIDRITAERVQTLAQRLLDEDQMVTAIIEPEAVKKPKTSSVKKAAPKK